MKPALPSGPSPSRRPRWLGGALVVVLTVGTLSACKAQPPAAGAEPQPAPTPALPAAAAPTPKPVAPKTPVPPPYTTAERAEQQAGYEVAQKHQQAGERAAARQALSRLLRKYPDFLMAQRDLVDLLLGDGAPEEVVTFMRDMVEARGPSAGNLFGLAFALARSGQEAGLKEAIGLLEEARRLRPDDPLASLTLAEVHAALGDRKSAAALYAVALKALQADGDWDRESASLLRYAQLLQLEGAPEAEAAFETAVQRAVAQKDADAEVLFRQGQATLLFSRGKVEPARAAFEAALAKARASGELEPQVAVLHNLARMHEELWEDGKAIERLHEVVQLLDAAKKPLEAAAARVEAGRMLGRVGRMAEAILALQSALDVFQKEDAWPAVADALEATGRIFRRYERYGDAAHALSQALEVRVPLAEALGDHRPLAEVLVELGEIEVLAGKVADGVPRLERALKLSERAGERAMIERSARALARGLFTAGQAESTVPLIERIESLGYEAPFLRARLAASREQLTEALTEGERAVDPILRLTPLELKERYGFLLHVYLHRSGPGDSRRAFALAVAGRAVHVIEQLQRLRVRVEVGVPAALLEQGHKLTAQEAGIERIIAAAGNEEVERAWEGRRRELRRELVAWRHAVLAQAPAYALLHFPEAVRSAAEQLKLAPDKAQLHPLVGADSAVIFVLQGDTVQAFEVEDQPDRARMVELLLRVRSEHIASDVDVSLVPPPGSQDFGWGFPLIPSAVVPVRRHDTPAPTTVPAAPLELPLVAPLKPVFEADYRGRVVQAEISAKQLDQGAGSAVELFVRAALFADAKAVRVLPEGGKPLVFTLP